jgi:hypothetical protein
MYGKRSRLPVEWSGQQANDPVMIVYFPSTPITEGPERRWVTCVPQPPPTMTWTDPDRYVTVLVIDRRLRWVARVPSSRLHNNYGRYGRGENADSPDTTHHETVKTNE